MFGISKSLSLLILGSSLIGTSAGAQVGALPTGSRLKEVVGPTTAIGVRPNAGIYKFSTTDPTNTGVVNREFNAIEPTWYGNWGGWTGPYTYNTGSFDEWVNWGVANKKQILMHMLTGPNLYNPAWFTRGTWTNAEMDGMLREMIRNVIQTNSNSTKVTVWNVVNEALASRGEYVPDQENKWHQLGWEADQSGLPHSQKINTQHPVYIRKAFQYAREYTRNELELRETMIEWYDGDRKSTAFYQLVKHLMNTGVPITAVGLQTHMYLWDTAEELSAANLKLQIQKYKALGLKVYITELDIGQTAGGDEEQRKRYYNIVKASREGGADGIYVWGVRDGADSWGDGKKPLLFDEKFNPKPAYYGVQQALSEALSE
jgi:endo-1,4-beta-xylanase